MASAFTFCITKRCRLYIYIYLSKQYSRFRSVRKPTAQPSFRLPAESTSVGKICTVYRLPDVGGGSVLAR
jgi:hypothetical protein